MMRRNKLPLGLIAVATAAGPAGLAAAETRSPMPEIVITGSRLPSTDTLPSVSVLVPDRGAGGSPTLSGLLERAPGVHVDAPGGLGGIGSLYIRGADPNHALVLVDGVKANDPTNTRGGSVDPTLLLLPGIARVTVVPGPAAAVHGADAIGGVVAVETRAGEAEPALELTGTIGPDGHRQLGAWAGGPLGDTRLALSAAHLDSGDVPSRNRLRGDQASARLDADGEGLRLTGIVRHLDYRATAFPEDAGGVELAVSPALESRDGTTTSAGLRLRADLARHWHLSLDAAALHLTERTDSPAVAPGAANPGGLPASLSDNRFDRRSLTAALHHMPVDGLQLVAGAALEREDGESDATLRFGPFALPARFGLDRDTRSLFTEAGWDDGAGLGGRLGLRHDTGPGRDGETSLSAGLHWSADGWRVNADYGEGFKLPSFYALANPLVGNPALRPERSRSLQLGLRRELTGLPGHVGLSLYRSRIEDIVDFEPGPPPRLVNRSRLDADGFEAEIGLGPLDGWSLDGSVGFVDADLAGDTPVRDRPRWRVGGRLGWTDGTVALRLDARHVGSLIDSAVPTGDVRLSGGSAVDIGVGWSPIPAVTLDVAVENLFDADRRLRIGTPEPGRRAFLSAEIRL